MIKALLRKKTARQWTAAPGERVYAIGDVHGCRDALDRLLATIDADDAARGGGATTRLVLLGDLVDRGRDSRGVIDTAMRLHAERPGRVDHLMGNHEEIMLGALDGDAAMLKLFAQYGGRETLLSYGMDEAEWQQCDWDALVARANALIPDEHREFLSRAKDHVVSGEYLFVHAGIRPGVALEQQRPADLRWIRAGFLQYRDFHPHMVVHGHTITEAVEERPNRIGIDTGCYQGGPLTAIGVEGDDRWYLSSAT